MNLFGKNRRWFLLHATTTSRAGGRVGFPGFLLVLGYAFGGGGGFFV